CSGCTCMLVCASISILHTRPRVQQAPGIPCSLSGGRDKCSCKPRAQMRRENANAHSVVVTRLVRNCALGRVTQYSRDVDDRTDRPRRTGCPAFAGHDGPVCLRRPAQAGADAWTPVMLYYNVCPMPHDHSHDHGHHHGHAHSHGPATPHPAQAAPWSILRMTVLSRLAAALAVSAALWAVVLVAMR